MFCNFVSVLQNAEQLFDIFAYSFSSKTEKTPSNRRFFGCMEKISPLSIIGQRGVSFYCISVDFFCNSEFMCEYCKFITRLTVDCKLSVVGDAAFLHRGGYKAYGDSCGKRLAVLNFS